MSTYENAILDSALAANQESVDALPGLHDLIFLADLAVRHVEPDFTVEQGPSPQGFETWLRVTPRGLSVRLIATAADTGTRLEAEIFQGPDPRRGGWERSRVSYLLNQLDQNGNATFNTLAATALAVQKILDQRSA